MQSGFVEKAIPLVSVDESGKYVVSEEAKKMLRGVNGPLAVVAVAGLYRTGKSYLLNRMLLNRGDGFGVGPTVNPCTKGLLCWGTPLKGISPEGETVDVIVVDTEGIGALDEDQTHDTKIFTLAVLASSVFIYNSVGSIDETAVQNLSLVVNLSKHIQLRSGEDDPDPDQMAASFPSFYWVVRDFSLQLVDTNGLALTSKEYLEKALTPQHGFSDDVQEKNRIRRLLTSFFRERECFTLIRPLVDQTKLQHLDSLSHDELRPEFVEQVIGFRRRVLNSVKIKTLQNKPLTGEMYVSMLTSYVGAINEGAVPNIEHAWRYMCEEQAQRTMAQSYEHFMCEIKDRFNTRFPCSEEDFVSVVSTAEEAALQLLRDKAIGDAVHEVLRQLKARIAERVSQLRLQNQKEATQILKQFIKKTVAPLQAKLRSREYKSYEEFETAVNNIYDHLVSSGPKLVQSSLQYMLAAKKLQQQGAKFMFLSLKKQFERVNEVAQQKETYFSGLIQKLRSEKEADRQKFLETIGESDERLSELRCKVEGLQTQLASISRMKEEEQKKLQRTISSRQSQLDTLRKTMEGRVTELIQRSQETGKQLSSERKEWEQEKAILELRWRQQQVTLEQMQRKEKTLDSTLHLSKNEMQAQLKELTYKHQRESEDLKRECTQVKEKLQELAEENQSIKEELQSKIEKYEKKEKKFRQEAITKNREYQRNRTDWEMEKQSLINQMQDLKDHNEREDTQSISRCATLEQGLKASAEEIKKLRVKYQDQMAVQMQRQEFAMEEFERTKRAFVSQRDVLLSQIASYEQKESMNREEGDNQRISELRNQHTLEVQTMHCNFESQKKRLLYQIETLTRKNGEVNLAVALLQSKLQQNAQEDQRSRSTVRDENEALRLLIKNLQRDSLMETQNKQTEFSRKLRELQNELIESKERGMNQLKEAHRISEENIMQLKNSYEINKMALQKKLVTEKERSEKRLTSTIEEYETRIRDATMALQQQNEELKANMNEQDQMMQREIHIRDHELDIARKKAEGLQKNINEMKESFNKREGDFTNKLEAAAAQARQEKDRHEAKLDALISDSNRKDKEIMALTHQKEQLTSTLDKKELRLAEVETEVIYIKEQNTLNIQSLRTKSAETQRENYDKLMAAVKDNALLKQENDFKQNKLQESSRALEIERQVQQEKYIRMKTEKQNQARTLADKLASEKNKLEQKHREFKNRVKEDEAANRKQINQLVRQKAILQERAFNAENKIREFDEKKIAEMNLLQTEVSKYKEICQQMRKKNSEEINQLRIELSQCQGERTDFKTALDRERILAANKLKFVQEQKQAQKKQLEEAVRQKQTKIELLNSSRLNDKTQTQSYLQDNMKNMEIKWRSKVQQLNQEITRRNYENDAAARNHQIQLKAAHQKYHYEKLSKEMIQNTSDKKIYQLTESLRKISEDIERIKIQKDSKDFQYQKKIKDENDLAKNKYHLMEQKAKEASTQKQMQYFEHQKQRVKWVMEKENLERKYQEIKDMSGKLQRDLTRIQRQNQKMKAQRKNGTKTHSYIKQLTTTFVEKNHDEENKENHLAQKE